MSKNSLINLRSELEKNVFMDYAEYTAIPTELNNSIIHGAFYFQNNSIKCLRNSPKQVYETSMLYGNLLISLDFLPISCGLIWAGQRLSL